MSIWKPGPAFDKYPHDFDPFPGPEEIECSQIAPRLWQGSLPPEGQTLAQFGFDVLVCCAGSYQPEDWQMTFPGLYHVVLCGYNDSFFPSRHDFACAERGGHLVAKFWKEGKNILVTCRAGLNRSGLVTAIALQEITKASGEWCVRRIRQRRYMALCNGEFAKYMYARTPTL